MEALEIEGQTDQTPLTRCCQFPTQGELAEAEDLLDNPDDRFDGTFAGLIDRFAYYRLEPIGHLHLSTCLLRWRLGERCEALLPARMMWVTTSRDVGFDAPLGTRSQGGRTKIASVKGRCLGHTDCRGNGFKSGFGFLTVIGMIGGGTSHDQQSLLIDSNLYIVNWGKK
jgi:hypothetical protein